MTWFWAITLTWETRDRTVTNTATGRLSPDQVRTLRTRSAVFPVVVAAGRRALYVPEDANACTLFFSLELDDLTATGRAA
jgi:hypothetical protein